MSTLPPHAWVAATAMVTNDERNDDRNDERFFEGPWRISFAKARCAPRLKTSLTRDRAAQWHRLRE